MPQHYCAFVTRDARALGVRLFFIDSLRSKLLRSRTLHGRARRSVQMNRREVVYVVTICVDRQLYHVILSVRGDK